MVSKTKFLIVSLLVLTAGVFASTPALASDNCTETGRRGSGDCQGLEKGPGIIGKVISINGNSLTVNGVSLSGDKTTAVTYTVDASKATFKKNKVASTLAGIVVGDIIKVQGAVSGTSITATFICNGPKGDSNGRKLGEREGRFSSVATSSGVDQIGPVNMGNNTNMKNIKGNRFGFFEQVGGFFKGIFRF